jgi:glycosyltransferase involved in cell wall biosynthesis
LQEYKFTYSLVVPVYNSSNSLRLLVSEIEKALLTETYQIIFIDDNSLDNSWDVLCEIKAKSKANIVLISFAHNSGQHLALYCGLMYTEGQYVVTLDDDLQHKPKELFKLKARLVEEKADLVYGIYEQKKHGALRNKGSKVFAAIVNKFASTPLQGSSFKMIHASIIEKVLQHQHFNFYLDEVLAWHSRKTSFAIVEHDERKMGSSGYSPVMLIKMSIRILLNYTALPLKFITYFGLFSSSVSFGFGIYYIYEKITNEAQTGFTAIIVSIFFSTGLILFSLGIMGEYISRIFLIQSGKPPFKIKEVEL